MNLMRNASLAAWITAFVLMKFVAVGTTCHAGENLLQNGSFEEPVLTTYLDYVQAAGWSCSPIPIMFREGYLFFPSPQDGEQYFGLGTQGYTVSQAFSTVSAGAYTLTFFMRGYEDASQHGGAGATGPSGLRVLIDGVSYAVDPITVGSAWQPRSLSFQLSPGSHSITFESTMQQAVVIDNVRLEGAGSPKISVTDASGTPISKLSFIDKKVLPLSVAPNRDHYEYGKFPVIHNVGSDGLVITAIKVEETDASDFFCVIAGLPALPLTLPAGGSVVVGVYFNPQDWGTTFPVTEHKKAVLKITPQFDDSVQVQLEGGQRFADVVNSTRVSWVPALTPGESTVTTGLRAIFSPDLDYTLGEAAGLGGFDHFNWWQVIVEYPALENCLATRPKTLVGPINCGDFCDTRRNSANTLPSLPALDPPIGGWQYQLCPPPFQDDLKPYYWSEDTPAQFPNAELDRNSGVQRNRYTGKALLFFDFPTQFKGGARTFNTSLAFVKTDGGFAGPPLPAFSGAWTVPEPTKLRLSAASEEDVATLTLYGFLEIDELSEPVRDVLRKSGIALPGDCDHDVWPPTITLGVETSKLWPPNHQIYKVTRRISAIDSCDPDPKIAINVTSNETPLDTGSGKTSQDWSVVLNDDGSYDVWLRAERTGKETDRVYAIMVTAIDASGNTSVETAFVTVPHDQSKK